MIVQLAPVPEFGAGSIILLRRVKGISQKMLTQTLRDQERRGLIVRHDMQTVPPHVTYDLTPLGQQLEAIDRWAEMHFLQLTPRSWIMTGAMLLLREPDRRATRCPQRENPQTPAVSARDGDWMAT